MSSVITNRSVKPFVDAVDLYPGFKLEEECFSKAVIKDMNEKYRKKKDEEPITYPREKPTVQISYERFLEEAINPKTGQFYPERDEDGTTKKGTGCTYYINSIYRLRRPTGEEYLYTKGTAYAFNSLGNPVKLGISMPEIWTKTNFLYKTHFDDKTNSLEKQFEGVSGNEQMYLKPFTKENLKELYDRRINDLIQLAVKKEGDSNAIEVKDVTTNITKSYELFRDKDFDYLINSNYIPAEIKAEARMEAVSKGWIHGNPGDYNQPAKGSTTGKNTYQ